MTKQQFSKLKVGDYVYLPGNRYTYTPILKIDRIFNKVSVLLGRKFYSYKYIPMKCPKNKHGLTVGMYYKEIT